MYTVDQLMAHSGNSESFIGVQSDSQHFKGLRRGVLRAFWDLEAENGVFFRTEVFLDSIFSFLLIF